MKPFILILMFLCSLLIVSAGENYTQAGNPSADFMIDGVGFFNTGITGVTSATRVLNNPKQIPLVVDLDNDGTNEIIVVDAGNIRLYHDHLLTIVDAYALSGDEEDSNIIAYDIDGDGDKELLIAETNSEKLHIITYNGTAIYNESLLSLSSLVHAPNADMMLGCRGVDDCLLMYATNETGGTAASRIYATAFTSSAIGTSTSVSTGTWSNSVYCAPATRTMAIADYDNDGTEEYIASFTQNEGSAEMAIKIVYVDVAAGTPTLEQSIFEQDSSLDLSSLAPLSCEEQREAVYVTPPLVYDIDGSPSNGMETVIGFKYNDDDEFKMYSYESDTSFLDDYPETFLADGVIISNVILTNAFTDTEAVDFCVMGFNKNNEIDLVCASEQTSETPETNEFFFDITDYYTLNGAVDQFVTIMHSVDMSSDTSLSDAGGGDVSQNLLEVLTAYGVFALDKTALSCGLTGSCDLSLIWENPQTDAAVIADDAEGIGRNDLLMLTSTNLWYYDDGFTNSPGLIDAYYINPCIDSTWKQNTTVEVRITPSDVDGDMVSARAILYDGGTNEQDSGWSNNVSSGATITFTFTANTTTAASTLTMQARDVENPTIIDDIPLTFSVGTNGVEFGECFTEVDVQTPAEAANASTSDVSLGDINDNSIRVTTRTMSDLSGLGEGVLWLLIMVIVAGSLWMYDSKDDSSHKLGIISIVEIGMLLIGVYLQLISAAVLIIFVVIGIIAVALIFKRTTTAGG